MERQTLLLDKKIKNITSNSSQSHSWPPDPWNLTSYSPSSFECLRLTMSNIELLIGHSRICSTYSIPHHSWRQSHSSNRSSLKSWEFLSDSSLFYIQYLVHGNHITMLALTQRLSRVLPSPVPLPWSCGSLCEPPTWPQWLYPCPHNLFFYTWVSL